MEMPTNEKCPNVSAINDSLRMTTIEPINGAIIPNNIPAINALNINSWVNKSVIKDKNIIHSPPALIPHFYGIGMKMKNLNSSIKRAYNLN